MSELDLDARLRLHRHGRVPAHLRREQILARAHELFVEVGYAGASMDELARRVGVTKPVIYNLVGNKEQLFREVMGALSAQLAARVAVAASNEPTLPGKLRQGIAAFLAFVDENRQGWSALLAMDAGPAGTEVMAMRRRLAELVGQLIAGGGGNESPVLAAVVGHAINGAVEFVATWWLEHPEAAADELTELLCGLLTPGLLALTGSAAEPAR